MTEDENIEFITEESIEDIGEISTEVEVEEQNLDEIIITEEDDNIELIEDATESTMEEVVVEVDVEEEEPVEIIVTEAADPTGVRITSDHSPYLPDQHTVSAITGLTERLEKLERFEHPDAVPLPEPVEAVETNQANYYLWDDENPNAENRDGYFVSIHQKQGVNRIYICNSFEDAFGVTVNTAGFIGNQSTNKRGSNYGLVVHSGVVAVKCESDVGVGDYVVSNKFGQAKKTDGTYGYLVTAISNIDGVEYAIISLTTPTTQMQRFSETTKDVSDRMDSAETNIATAISVANAAYNKAQVAQDWVQGNVENIAGDVVIIGGKVDNIVTDIENLDTKVVNATTEALKAQSESSAVRTEANQANNATNSHISSLINALNPDKTWTDPENMDMWNDYFADYIKDGNIPTTSQIKELDGNLTHANSMISQNALGIENIVTSIDNYSVGEWSQAYGLNLAEAWNILKVGMIYIPTPEIHREKYEYETINSWGDEEEIKKRDTNTIYRTIDDGLYWRYLPAAGDGNLTYEWTGLPLEYEENGETQDYVVKDEYEFTRGYYYTWNGFYWVESENPYVYFSARYVNPSQECQYWYVDSHENLDHEGTIYKARGLYKWDGFKWTEVNILAGNITNRATSSLIQTATEIAANVTNARGWMAHMGVKITEDGSFVDQIASVVTPLLVGDDKHKIMLEEQYILNEVPTDSIVGVEGQYYAVGTEQPYDVYIYQDGTWQKKHLLYYDGVYIMKINTSSILLSANEDEAIVSVNGPAIFTADENGGVTGINGSCITTGTIASNDGTVKIDLGEGTAGISGKITATSGYIGDKDNGFTIDTHDTSGMYYLANSQWDLYGNNTGNAGVYISPLGIGLGNGNFHITNTGDVSMRGNIDMGGSITLGGDITFADTGKITWTNTSNPCKALYHSGKTSSGSSVSTPSKPESNGSYGGSASYSWHTIFQESADSSKGLYPDYYVSYTYDGGTTWTDPIQIRGKDGASGPQGDPGVTEVDVEEMLQKVYGITSTEITDTSIGSPYIYSPNIEGGTIKGVEFIVTGTTDNNGDSAYYIYDDDTLMGSLRYDYDGINAYLEDLFSGIEGDGDIVINGITYTVAQVANLIHDAKERVFLSTQDGVVLKLQSGGDMSLSAGELTDDGIGTGKIYFCSPVVFAGGITGTINASATATFG